MKTAAKEYAQATIKSFGRNGVPCGTSDIMQMIAEGFIAGVRWYKKNQWIKVGEGERFPKDGMYILVRRHYKNRAGQLVTKVTQEMYFTDFGFKPMCSKLCNERITHWMPVPQP
jgi:hypothetical protein